MGEHIPGVIVHSRPRHSAHSIHFDSVQSSGASNTILLFQTLTDTFGIPYWHQSMQSGLENQVRPETYFGSRTLSSQPGTAEVNFLLSSFSIAAPKYTKRILENLKSSKIG